jgi:soluble lytic murein transglycosylase-like protein
MFFRFLVSLIFIVNNAAAFDKASNESSKCIVNFDIFENKYFIPRDTLYSIAIKESGRAHPVHKIKMPWPWAINVGGASYYFDSKQEAVNFVKHQIIKGKDNIDVGCMQVSLKYHAHAFQTLEDAFDPKMNIAYAASFLRSKYDNFHSWHKAIAHYHSATFELGYKYKQDVINIASNMHLYKTSLGSNIHNANLVELDGAPHTRAEPISSYKAKPASRLRSNLLVPVYSRSMPMAH